MMSGKIIRALLVTAMVVAAPARLLADDAELFTTRANPNVLLMLDTTGSMDTVDSASGVGNLDGQSPTGSRMDILWKVVYSLLNADMSIPSSGTRLTATVRRGFDEETPTRIRVTPVSTWSSFPSTGTIYVGSGANVDTVTYTSKLLSGGNYYFYISSATPFNHPHTRGEQVVYTAGGTYTQPFPSTNAEATGAYQDSPYNLTQADEEVLKARLGLMTFTTGSGGVPALNIRNSIASGANNAPPFTPSYRQIWDSVVQYAYASGGTPTAQAAYKAKTFFDDAYNATDSCRKNFIVLITDGEDTAGLPSSASGYIPAGSGGNLGGPYYYRSGSSYSQTYVSGYTFNSDGYSGTGRNTGQVARHNQLIQAAQWLKNSNRNVEVFTVGVGISADVPHLRVLRRVLQRAAAQDGVTLDAAGYDAVGAVATDNTIGKDRAFFATDARDLASALTRIFQQITAGTFSFTAPTVLSVRTVEKNELFLASFIPQGAPATCWEGHLKAYTLTGGAFDNVERWDAGSLLVARDPGSRRIFTSDNTWGRMDFSAVTAADLNVSSAARDNVVNYVFGYGHDNNVKLGDIFHSKPVLVGAPSPFYYDQGYNTAVPSTGQSFLQAKAARRRVIYAGANDGMLHAFHGGDWHPPASGQPGYYSSADNGAELFGYIPHNLLREIQAFVPSRASTHDFFVDSSPRVSDIWTDNNSDGVKQSSEWRTILIAGLRKGGTSYFALDITNPPSGTDYSSYPNVLWEYSSPDNLAETWSEPYIAKVKVKDSAGGAAKDKFVAIFGGGVSASGQTGNTLTILDAWTGAPLKIFTGLDNEIASSPTVVLDLQGYVRFAFVPDLGGNLYKFDLRLPGNNYGSNPFDNWGVTKIFQAPSGGQPAYHRAEVATVDALGSTRYIFFGTGDREHPISSMASGKFYMIIDTDTSTTTRTEGNLQDFTSNITAASGGSLGSGYGWYVQLGNIVATANMNDSYGHVGEKVLSDPTVFYNRVYFTTFTPNAANPCSGGGTARLYGLNWNNAGAGMEPISASPHGETKTTDAPFVPSHVYAGKGIPSSPSLSINPWDQSSMFIGFSDGTFKEISVASPPASKRIRSWMEQ